MDYSLMMGIQYLAKDGEKRITKSYSKLMGGLEGTAVKGVLDQASHDACIFYIGIVDMLVTYSFKKKAAHFLKSNTIGFFDEIDTEPPDVYARRFRQHFVKKILPNTERVAITEVPSKYFESPMPAMGRSGGTAAFFKATLIASEDECPEAAESKNYWIAKDLGRAADEVDFYEIAKKLEGDEGFEFLKWMTPYKGVSNALCQVHEKGDPSPVQVMLLRNGRDGYETCRMLDIKMGWATAVSGWQG